MTYPHELVKAEIEGHWVGSGFDVSERKAVAAAFGVEAIPVAVALSPDGEVLDRILGYVDPEPFAERLAALRR